jgi:hypothetical protein
MAVEILLQSFDYIELIKKYNYNNIKIISLLQVYPINLFKNEERPSYVR